MKKCALGLSGGVDSAAAAALLMREGYEVTGVFLDTGFSGAEGARASAEALGIELIVSDAAKAFERSVTGPFIEEYLRGRTPNPCVICNPEVKFAALAREADKIGAPWIATGHYARVIKDENGRAGLFRALSRKDQSYMLYRLPSFILSRAVFPLGGLSGKDETRAIAASMSLPPADKPDSMDICFIPSGDYAGWIEERIKKVPPPGDFTDENGRTLGRHMGVHRYTVGQRRGLGVSSSGRLFVKCIDREKNRVILSDRDVSARGLSLEDTVYIPEGLGDAEEFHASVRLRLSKKAWDARVYPMDKGRARVVFDTPARAPAPGQSAVFYEGERVLGGGIIASVTD